MTAPDTSPQDMDDSDLSREIAKKRRGMDRVGNILHYGSGILAVIGLGVLMTGGVAALPMIIMVGVPVIGLPILAAVMMRGHVTGLKQEQAELQAEQEDRFTNPSKHLKKMGEKFERAVRGGVQSDIKVKKPLQIKKPQP